MLGDGARQISLANEEGTGFTRGAESLANMDAEKTKDFNKRLSQWVASQGFWFQVRYSMISSGSSGRAMFHLIQMLTRVAIFMVLVSAVVWFGLVRHKKSDGFRQGVVDRIQIGLSAKDVEVRGAIQSRGQLEMARVVAEGGNGTFFKSLEASSIRCKMSLVDGIIGVWRPGVVSVARMNAILIPGADDANSAEALSEVIFGQSAKIDLGVIEVAKANIEWGFTNRTQGAIRGSWMRAQRTATGWRIIFKGGTFSQNWFKDLEIDKLVVICEPDGLIFDEAVFTQDGGVVDFSGLKLEAGARPELDGMLMAKNLNIEKMLPEAARDYMEGRISGRFQVFGSPNGSDGVGFDGEVVLGEGDQVILRDKIHVLKALSVMDYSRNYHRVDLSRGSMKMRTIQGGMELSDVNLVDPDFFTLKGQLSVRLPTQREIRAAIAKEEAKKGNDMFKPKPEEKPKESSELKLELPKDGGMENLRVKDEPEESGLYERLSMLEEMRMLELEATSKMSRMLKCDGLFEITIPGNAFERAQELREIYPVDPKTKRITMEIPVVGDMVDITLPLAEEIYEKGRR